MKRDYRQLPPNQLGREPIDVLLSTFFKSEMPSKWPAFQPSALTRLPLEPARAMRRPSYAGRFALAASVGLLFVGSWLLPAVTTRSPRSESLPTIGPASANRGGLLPVQLQPEKPGTLTPDKVKSSLHLEQGADGRTGVKITVEEYPPPK